MFYCTYFILTPPREKIFITTVSDAEVVTLLWEKRTIPKMGDLIATIAPKEISSDHVIIKKIIKKFTTLILF
jgi:hypothetical protein